MSGVLPQDDLTIIQLEEGVDPSSGRPKPPALIALCGLTLDAPSPTTATAAITAAAVTPLSALDWRLHADAAAAAAAGSVVVAGTSYTEQQCYLEALRCNSDDSDAWRKLGLTHVCLRTLGGELSTEQHLDKLSEIVDQIPRGSTP